MSDDDGSDWAKIGDLSTDPLAELRASVERHFAMQLRERVVELAAGLGRQRTPEQIDAKVAEWMGPADDDRLC